MWHWLTAREIWFYIVHILYIRLHNGDAHSMYKCTRIWTIIFVGIILRAIFGWRIKYHNSKISCNFSTKKLQAKANGDICVCIFLHVSVARSEQSVLLTMYYDGRCRDTGVHTTIIHSDG